MAEPAARAVAVLPLNWAIRKRLASFGSLVSNVNMKQSPVHATVAIYRYPTVNIGSRSSTADARIRCQVRVFSTISVGGAGEHGFHLGLQRCGVERLDDVVVHAGLLRRDHVLGF